MFHNAYQENLFNLRKDLELFPKDFNGWRLWVINEGEIDRRIVPEEIMSKDVQKKFIEKAAEELKFPHPYLVTSKDLYKNFLFISGKTLRWLYEAYGMQIRNLKLKLDVIPKTFEEWKSVYIFPGKNIHFKDMPEEIEYLFFKHALLERAHRKNVLELTAKDLGQPFNFLNKDNLLTFVTTYGGMEMLHQAVLIPQWAKEIVEEYKKGPIDWKSFPLEVVKEAHRQIILGELPGYKDIVKNCYGGEDQVRTILRIAKNPQLNSSKANYFAAFWLIIGLADVLTNLEIEKGEKLTPENFYNIAINSAFNFSFGAASVSELVKYAQRFIEIKGEEDVPLDLIEKLLGSMQQIGLSSKFKELKEEIQERLSARSIAIIITLDRNEEIKEDDNSGLLEKLRKQVASSPFLRQGP